jgi:hypothetical protein
MASIGIDLVRHGLADSFARFAILTALGLAAYIVQGTSRRFRPFARFVLTGCIGIIVATIVMQLVLSLAARLA